MTVPAPTTVGAILESSEQICPNARYGTCVGTSAGRLCLRGESSPRIGRTTHLILRRTLVLRTGPHRQMRMAPEEGRECRLAALAALGHSQWAPLVPAVAPQVAQPV
eukprot:6819952-Lingulodinium_polyedra.AAC.1